MAPLAYDPGDYGVSADEERRLREGNLLPEGELILRVDKPSIVAVARSFEGGPSFDEDGTYLEASVQLEVVPEYNDPEKIEGKSRRATQTFNIFNHTLYDLSELPSNLRQMHDINMRDLIKFVSNVGVPIPDGASGKNYLAPFSSGDMQGVLVKAVNKYRPNKENPEIKYNNLSRWQPFEAV